MTKEGRSAMEKIFGEDDIKGLEEEIDSAVDRLFVEKKGNVAEKPSIKEPISEPSYEPVKASLQENSFKPSAEPPKASLQEEFSKPPAEPTQSPLQEDFSDSSAEALRTFFQEEFSKPPAEATRTLLREDSSKPSADPLKTFFQEECSKPPVEAPKTSVRQDVSKPSDESLSSMKPFEMMETQVLSLEWEITKENLQKTTKEVVSLQEIFKERHDITSILNLMAKVLTHMIKNEEHIEPSQIKFLLDSKETIKFLMKKETGSEWNIYKQLLLGGIEARFLCLDGVKETRPQPPSADGNEERERGQIQKIWEQQIEGKLSNMGLSIEKVETTLEKINQDLCRLGQLRQISPVEFVGKKLSPVGITILKTGGKLFGIESEKIFKLFKVSGAFKDKILSQERIRIKDLEIQMVDLKKIFFIEGASPTGEVQILTVKEDAKYRGVMVDQVLKKFLTEADISGNYGEYFLGMFHWTYQEKSMEIPILNLRKI